jgi:gamma-glutamylcysteine synthetase
MVPRFLRKFLTPDYHIIHRESYIIMRRILASALDTINSMNMYGLTNSKAYGHSWEASSSTIIQNFSDFYVAIRFITVLAIARRWTKGRDREIKLISLVSNFRRVLNVVYFLLGNSPASEFQTAGNYPEESIQKLISCGFKYIWCAFVQSIECRSVV